MSIIKYEWCVKCIGIKKKDSCQEKKEAKQAVPGKMFCVEHEIMSVIIIERQTLVVKKIEVIKNCLSYETI